MSTNEGKLGVIGSHQEMQELKKFFCVVFGKNTVLMLKLWLLEKRKNKSLQFKMIKVIVIYEGSHRK